MGTLRLSLPVLLLLALLLTACAVPPPPVAVPVSQENAVDGETETENEMEMEMNDSDKYTGSVTEIAIRRVQPDQEISVFGAARDAFVERLRQQSGVTVDREFVAFLDFATFGPPEPPVFVGMTEYESLDAFMAAGAALGDAPETAAFFATFTPETFTVLRPLNPSDRYELAALAGEPDQVLEIAVRDLSAYTEFDLEEYAALRDAFLTALSQQEGFVAEYQWVSLLDPSIVVGMTVYASAEAFQAIATSPFAQSAISTDFAGGYPPVVGYVSANARQ